MFAGLRILSIVDEFNVGEWREVDGERRGWQYMSTFLAYARRLAVLWCASKQFSE